MHRHLGLPTFGPVIRVLNTVRTTVPELPATNKRIYLPWLWHSSAAAASSSCSSRTDPQRPPSEHELVDRAV